jgi:fibronectin type 3 domain-containing protein
MKGFVPVLLVLWTSWTNAQSVTVTWEASPTLGLAGYRVYYGTNSHSYSFVTNAGLVRTQQVTLPQGGRWFFAATARDTNGLESVLSNEVEWEARPEPPVMQGEPVVRLAPVIEWSTNQTNWLSLTGAPTFLAATNAAEYFRAQRLVIETVRRVEEP